MERKKLKVAVIEPIGGHGGNEFYDFGICESVALSNDVKFYTCDETVLHENAEVKTEVIKCYKGIYGNAPKFVRGFNYLKGIFCSLFSCLKNKTDIVHLHAYGFSFFESLSIRLFKLAGFKVIVTVHDIEPFDRFGSEININYNKFLKPADVIIVHTDFSIECLSKILNEENRKKLRKVKSGDLDFVYNKDIPMDEARKALSLPLDKKLILFFGQIKKVKGVDLLINAFNRIARENPDLDLVIAGRPWKVDINEYLKLIEEDVKNRIHLRLNYIPNEEVPLYFKACDITVLPYRKIYNSSVILRAFDYGCAVIASDLPTFKEFVIDGENGLLFKSEDVEDLIDKINFIFENEGMIERFKKNAKLFVEENFSREIINRQMNEIFDLVLNNRLK